jgi:hypothetical protein
MNSWRRRRCTKRRANRSVSPKVPSIYGRVVTRGPDLIEFTERIAIVALSRRIRLGEKATGSTMQERVGPEVIEDLNPFRIAREQADRALR